MKNKLVPYLRYCIVCHSKMHKISPYNFEKENFRKKPVNYKNRYSDYFAIFNCKKCKKVRYHYKKEKSQHFINITVDKLLFLMEERVYKLYFNSVQFGEKPIINYYSINTIQDCFKLSKKILDNQMFI